MRVVLAFVLLLFATSATAQRATPGGAAEVIAIDAVRVFDGEQMQSNWRVVVEGRTIKAAGPQSQVAVPTGARRISVDNGTLLPGLIEGHGHLLLHPYNEVPWNDQVLKESRAERVARGVVHAEKTLMAGFTTLRDLGSEGAGYADVGLKDAINKGVVPGPDLLVAGRAIVATGSYGPKGFDPDWEVPLGAEPADGPDLIRVTRDQIGKGADFIKIYADYRWGARGQAAPTFSVEEIRSIVEAAASSGRPVVAHASTAEGMRRAIEGGVETIEHGDDGSPEVFRLMAERGVVWYPTLAAVESIMGYGGWVRGQGAEPARLTAKKAAVKTALEAGVQIGMGGDVGVYTHGTNALEMELMVEYGISSLDVLKAATSLNADTFHLADRGRIAEGKRADLILVVGDPVAQMSAIRNVHMVMKNGLVVRGAQ